MDIDAEIFKAYDIRGLYGEQIDGDVAEQIGRAFVRVIADLAGKRRASCGSAWAATCGSRARRWPRATATAWWPRAPTSSTPGWSAPRCSTSSSARSCLDGGLMCTASHNPKAYTGAKLVERGAIALSGDRGIHDIRRAIEARPRRRAAAAASPRRSMSPTDFHAAALSFIDPDKSRR